MAWPFNRQTEESKVTDPEKKPEPTSNEKSVAEMISESLAPFGQRFDKLQQDIDALRAPKESVRTVSAEKISVLDDEDAAFNQRMGPMLQSQLEMEARMNTREVKQEYVDAGFGDLWRQHEKGIESTLKGAALVS